jgi:hypothetical protein
MQDVQISAGRTSTTRSQQQHEITTTWGERLAKSPSGVFFIPYVQLAAQVLKSPSSLLPLAQWVANKAVLRDKAGPKKKIVEELWWEFFSNPSQWWYHRAEKAHAGYPDFEHKTKAQKALWLDDRQKPSWV